ncbi:MAG TPA: hypothetical protein PLW02_00650 [Verrucomicrobiota bacterium]|nr:hypothetical protein [Verrucomicrobiota bacterium]
MVGAPLLPIALRPSARMPTPYCELQARIPVINLHLSAFLNICEYLREIIYHLLCGVKQPLGILVLNQKYHTQIRLLSVC